METAIERLVFRATDAQRVALICAVEAADPSGLVLEQGARRAATDAARRAAGERSERWLAARARLLAAQLTGDSRALSGRLLEVTDPGRGWLLAALTLGFLLGLATNALGPSRQVHILALPLLGILIWNLLVLVLVVVRRALPVSAPWRRAIGARLRGLAARAARRSVAAGGYEGSAAVPGGAPESSQGTVDNDPVPEIRRRAVDGFLRAWLPAAGPLSAARLERALHAAALAVAAGIVAGMYLRGLAFEYRAAWESTFLGPEAVQRLADSVLGAASAVSGIDIPSVAGVRDGDSSAAPWIHLWAATTALAVGAPRLLLFVLADLRARRRRRRLALELPSAYLRRLLSAVDPTSRRVDLLSYSYHPAAVALTELKQLLLDVFGARAEIRPQHLDYGAAVPAAEDSGARCRLLLMSLAQTPEAEVHGKLVTGLAEATAAGQALLVVLDAGVYKRRLGAGSESRLEDRRRAWERVLATSGVQPAVVDLESGTASTAMLFAAAWPAGALADLEKRG